jgi:hypothetical protein
MIATLVQTSLAILSTQFDHHDIYGAAHPAQRRRRRRRKTLIA